jgi:hypothetical protein
LIVPSDCTASIRTEDNEYALKQMQRVLKASIQSSPEIEFVRASETLNAGSAAG